MSVGERSGQATPADGARDDSRAARIAALRGRRKRADKKEPKTFGGQVLELALIIVIALGLAFGIQALLVKPYRIPSESMLPTLHVNQRVLVDRIGSRFRDPKVGDVTVFHPPTNAEMQQCGVSHPADEACPQSSPKKSKVNFIKRIVAGPGDTIAIRDGHVIRNGHEAKEPFIIPCDGDEDCTFTRPFKVPAGEYFMMGDNRGESDDSRYWGPVPKKWIIGPAFLTYWPPSRIGFP